MSGQWGQNLRVSIFGESHGVGIGVVIDGLPSGLALDWDQIRQEMKRRAPGQNAMSTARREADEPQVLSGFFNGYTTGTPLCVTIANTNTRSKDYANLNDTVRPGHADYTGYMRYDGYNDYRGGGHFSGRITAPLVFCGAVCKQLLAQKNIWIGAHIQQIHAVQDKPMTQAHLTKAQFAHWQTQTLPTVDQSAAEKMEQAIATAKENGDSVGGMVECAAIGLPAGVGDPFFDSVESVLSHLFFSVPAVKGVEFGLGFAMAALTGSVCNDPYTFEQGKVKTTSNHNGGILGGITNGMPVVCRVAIKPTASIAKEQKTISLANQTDTTLVIKGRHDPCIVQRAVPVIEAAMAIGLTDLLLAYAGRAGWKTI